MGRSNQRGPEATGPSIEIAQRAKGLLQIFVEVGVCRSLWVVIPGRPFQPQAEGGAHLLASRAIRFRQVVLSVLGESDPKRLFAVGLVSAQVLSRGVARIGSGLTTKPRRC